MSLMVLVMESSGIVELECRLFVSALTVVLFMSAVSNSPELVPARKSASEDWVIFICLSDAEEFGQVLAICPCCLQIKHGCFCR